MTLLDQWIAVIEAHPRQLHHAVIGAWSLVVAVLAMGLVL